MNWLKRWTSAALLSGFIAVLLSFFSQVDGLVAQKEAPSVFKHEIITLSNHNIVDELSKIDLSQPISRVDWSGSVLSVDLKVHAENRIQLAQIYDDLFLLCQLAFAQTDNVNQVLIRILNDETSALLLALDGNRQQWDHQKAQRVVDRKITSDQFLIETFRLIY